MPFSAGQLLAVAVAIVSASGLSICGTVVVVLVFALFPTVRIFPLKLVLFLTLADALTSVASKRIGAASTLEMGRGFLPSRWV